MAMLAKLMGRRLGVRAVSPIIPIIVGSEERAMAASAALLLRGYHVPAIRPPTVPAGTSRYASCSKPEHSPAPAVVKLSLLMPTIVEVCRSLCVSLAKQA